MIAVFDQLSQKQSSMVRLKSRDGHNSSASMINSQGVIVISASADSFNKKNKSKSRKDIQRKSTKNEDLNDAI